MKKTSFLKIPINRILALLFLDIISVLTASFAAIYLRFEFRFNEIPRIYLERYEHIIPVTIIVTLFFFFMWRLYKSVWRYASATEMVNIILATGCSALAQWVLCAILKQDMPRSYYVLYWIFLFGLTCIIRFSYRILRLINSKRMSLGRSTGVVNVMV